MNPKTNPEKAKHLSKNAPTMLVTSRMTRSAHVKPDAKAARHPAVADVVPSN